LLALTARSRIEQTMQHQAKPDPAPLWSAMLLAATGGLLDAVVYLNHGRVFATAMTGNLVLLGISVVSERGAVAVRYCVPLVAYFFCVSISKWARARMPKAGIAALVLEMLCLLIAGFLAPSFPDMVLVGIVAFAGALRLASFRRVGPFSYSSTFITGDLLDTSEGVGEALLGSSPENRVRGRLKARDLGLICLAFLVGAAAGAFAAPRVHNASFWFAEPVLAVILIDTVIHPRRGSSAERSATIAGSASR
jgi:uncharacterized membrane protein YoaK (UPF0700 family)